MSNLRIGRADVKPNTPAHVKGTREGNMRNSYFRQIGHRKDGRSSARRSTGIGAHKRDSVVPGSPNISPP